MRGRIVGRLAELLGAPADVDPSSAATRVFELLAAQVALVAPAEEKS